jgi:hypothetical protein
MTGQFRRNDLPRIDAAAVGALQGAQVGSFDAAKIAVDLVGNGGSPLPQLTVGGE